VKVLQVINSLATGGAEKLLVETLPLFNDVVDVEMDLVLLDGKEYPFTESVKNKDFKVFSLSKGSSYNPLNIFKLIKFMGSYDIIHAHLFPTQYWVVLAKILSFKGVKLIFTEHSTSNRRLSNPVFRLIDRFVYRYYKSVICISDEVKNALTRYYGIPNNKLIVVHNGVNISKILNSSPHSKEQFGYSSSSILLCMVAGFRDEKDQLTLIKAMKKLPKNYHLILVGDGKNKEALLNFVKSEEMFDRIKFLGNRNDVPSILKMIDISVLSSHIEGFGLSAVESMVLGKPTIGSNVPGLSDVLENGGLLFERGNVDDLVAQLKKLEDKDFYEEISRLGKSKGAQYDINFQVGAILEAYKSILI